MAEQSSKPATSVAEPEPARSREEDVPRGAGEAAESRRTFTPWERFQILVATWIGYFAVLLIGRTLRWEVVGWANFEAARQIGKSVIYAFWHCEIFSATWFWRRRGIVVMTSRNFDGEYIGRIIQRHGYGAARGSSSRGGARALVEMIRAIRKGRLAGFTVDGPRGPRHVAKPGVVLLAKATGAPILCFHIVPARASILRKTWDRTEIPHPFSRAAIFIAPPIAVNPDAGDEEQARKLREVQATLDELVSRGQEWKAEKQIKRRNSKSKT